MRRFAESGEYDELLILFKKGNQVVLPRLKSSGLAQTNLQGTGKKKEEDADRRIGGKRLLKKGQ